MEKKIVFLGLFLGVVHFAAVLNSWYWVFSWMDIPMHFLGGAFAGIIFVWSMNKLQMILNHRLKFFILTLLLLGFVALIGVLWEFFEFAYDLFVASKGWGVLASQGVADLIGDLFFDLLGGLAVVVFTRFGYNKREV